MQIVHSLEELRIALERLRGGGRTLALVPTMGALHAGHMALVDRGRALADRVAASIFVNPLQFGPGEDLDRYPRRAEADAEMLREHGCDLVWLPRAEDLYPDGFATSIRVADLSERWEGEARPGHFDGVATVVAKLLIAVAPDVALFGEKDFQQLAVVRRLVRDLALPVRVESIATVRDPDGLALSSRNAYLSADQRARALVLPRALRAASDALRDGVPVAEALEDARRSLKAAGFAPIDYVALVDGETLEPVEHPGPGQRLIAAATIGTTRLIDNLELQSSAPEG